ncbi:hypothetical protein BGZ58_005170 [Dissophora ornata]|nr:hypothetical protein BGZ58_005170 [Dissophora ornata]
MAQEQHSPTTATALVGVPFAAAERTQLSLVPSAYKVFQIPELADNIAQYLWPVYLSQLRLVSRVLYTAFIPHLRLHLHRNSTASWTDFPLLQHGIPGNGQNAFTSSKAVGTGAEKEIAVAEKHGQAGGPRKGKGVAHVYGELVQTITADSMDNFDTLVPMLQYCPNLSKLTVTRWSKDLYIFHDILSTLPRLQHLSVSFYNTVDLDAFLATLVSMSDPSKEAINGGGHGSLQSLDIKHRVPDINYIRWETFKSALRKFPSLQHLSLAGIGFRAGKTTVEPATTAGQNATPNTTSSTAMTANVQVQGQGNNEYGDGEDELQSFEMSIHATSWTFPRLRSLVLSFCECPVTTMLDLDRIFPRLTSLEVNKCRSNWLEAFEPDPLNPSSHFGIYSSLASSLSSLGSTAAADPTATTTATIATGTTFSASRHVPFPDIRHLKLVERQEGHEDLIYEIIKARPRLVSIETYQISLNIETLLPMAYFCWNESRSMNRFSLSPCWSDTQTRGDFERFFESPFLCRVKHLYIQQEITEKMCFASTLTSLHVGAGFARESVIEYDSLPVWNSILRRLPKLEILRIDRFIKDYVLFEGLGRSTTPTVIPGGGVGGPCQMKLNSDSAESATTIEDWSQERPYLQELQITFRASCVIDTSDLDRELVQRFRFLERLYFSCSKRPEDLEDRKAKWRPGLAVEYRRYENE